MFSFDDAKYKVKKTTRQCRIVVGGVAMLAISVSSVPMNASFRYDDYPSIAKELVAKATNIDSQGWKIVLTNSKYQELEQLLLQSREYCDDWDGEGAKAVQPEAINNVSTILNRLMSDGLRLPDDILPTEFGTLCIEWSDGPSGQLLNAEISEDRMAFYFDRPGEKLISYRPDSFNRQNQDNLLRFVAQL